MKRFIVIKRTLLLILVLLQTSVASTAQAAPPVESFSPSPDYATVLTRDVNLRDNWAEITRGIVLIQPREAENEWSFNIIADGTPRKFELIDGVLWYTPVINGVEQVPTDVYLIPEEKIETEFESGDMYIFVIEAGETNQENEDNDENELNQYNLANEVSKVNEENKLLQSIHVRLGADDMLPVRVMNMDNTVVRIGREFLAIDEEKTEEEQASIDAAEEMETERLELKWEDEIQNRETAREQEIERLEMDNKDRLYESIPWAALGESSDDTKQINITVSLKTNSSGEWVVRSAEEATVSTVVSISVWVLCASVLLALVLNIILLISHRKKA